MNRASQPPSVANSKAEPGLDQLVRSLGVMLEARADGLVGTCPFHVGDVTSHELTVDSSRGRWSCQACCPAGGDALELVMRAEGVSRRHALALLGSGAPLTGRALRRRKGGRGSGLVKATTVRPLALDLHAVEDDALLGHVASYYHQVLLQSAEATEWLERHGLGDPELVETFRLGLADRTLGLHLPLANRQHGAGVRRRLQRLGVLRKSGHECLNGCLVIPLLDEGGRVVQLCGHRLAERCKGGASREVWLDEHRAGLFNRDAFAAPEVIVAGSLLEAMRLWGLGHRNVTALHGFDGPLDDLLGAVTRHGTRRVSLMLPTTREGNAAADRVAAALVAAGFEVRRPCVVIAETDPSSTSADASAVTASARPAVSAPSTRSDPAHSEAESSPTTTASPDHDELVLTLGDRRWRVRGLSTNRARGTLRVNLLVSRPDVGVHVDVLDVSAARHRHTFARMAADELRIDEAVVRKDLGQVLLALEEAQDELLRRVEAPADATPAMTEAQREAATALLQDPRLLDRVLDDLECLGVVGERTNLLLAYLATVSRMLPEPLSVLMQSSAAAGKSSVVNAVLALVPDEARVVLSALTGQSLYYMGRTDLRHKVLCIAEDRGMQRASYALKLLQSEGAIAIASTGKDPGTGRLVSQHYGVEGPVALVMTTTSIDIDDELLSRCIILAVDESPEQTRRIHQRQRVAQTLEGLRDKAERERILRLHHDAQRLLRPVRVVNPHVAGLGSPDLRVQARRDFRKLLGLVEVLAALHQHQRRVTSIEHGGRTVEVVEATTDDVALAQRLAAHLGAGLDDLPPQTRRVLGLVDDFVQARAGQLGLHRDRVRFSRRELREHAGLGDTQLKVHLGRLVDHELVLAHRATLGRGVVYSVAFDQGAARYACDAEPAGYGRPSVGPRSGQGRPSGGPSSAAESPASTGAWVASESADDEKRTSESVTPGDVRVPASEVEA